MTERAIRNVRTGGNISNVYKKSFAFWNIRRTKSKLRQKKLYRGNIFSLLTVFTKLCIWLHENKNIHKTFFITWCKKTNNKSIFDSIHSKYQGLTVACLKDSWKSADIFSDNQFWVNFVVQSSYILVSSYAVSQQFNPNKIREERALGCYKFSQSLK